MRKIFHRFFTIILVVGSILFLVDFLWACSCAISPIDSEIGSQNIVVLELKAVEKCKDNDTGCGEDNIKKSKLIVKNSFKGKILVGQELNFTQGWGADCIWGFSEKDIGTKYLFFLNKNNFSDGLWKGPVCSRSASLRFAAADLLYVEKYKKVFGKTRLSGMIYNVTEKKSDKPWREFNYEPIAGRKLRIVGKGVDITLKTNKNGAYEIYDLPVGKYRIMPQEVKGYRFLIPDNETDEVEIKANSLTEQNIEYLVD
ncbi:MAG: prealbumin-like fold domain-containing protein [Pyrinomonadaceae bacterium]|nr:prealbumin-like fold domain-containing protein [Pyrinomonadaceae bacterium]